MSASFSLPGKKKKKQQQQKTAKLLKKHIHTVVNLQIFAKPFELYENMLFRTE